MNDTLLIVDDETKIRELLSRILSYEGYDILQAADLAQASKILSSQQVDLIICDVKLPDGSGVVYSREVKQRMPKASCSAIRPGHSPGRPKAKRGFLKKPTRERFFWTRLGRCPLSCRPSS